MKEYKIFRLKCKCSKRMRKRGKLVRVYEKTASRKCPNCGKEYEILKKNPWLKVA